MTEVWLTELWLAAGLVAAAYCIVRGIVDLRQRRFIWGALGILSGIVIMTLPIQTHAVKIDLPGPVNSQG